MADGVELDFSKAKEEGEKAGEAIKSSMEKSINSVDVGALKGKISEIKSAAESSINSIGDSIGKLISNLCDSLNQIDKNLKINVSFNQEKDYKAEAEQTAEVIKNSLKSIKEKISEIKIDKLKDKIFELKFTSLITIALIKENLGKILKEGAKNCLGNIVEKGKEAAGNLAVSGIGKVMMLKDKAIEAFKNIDFFGSAMELGKKGILGMISLAQSLGGVLNKAVSAAVGVINYDWKGLAEEFSSSEGAKGKAEKLQTNSDGIKDSVTSIKAGLFDMVAEPLVDATDQVNTIVSNISNEFLTNGVPALGTAIAEGIPQILSVINSTLPQFVSSVTEIINGVTASIREFLSSEDNTNGIAQTALGIIMTFVNGIIAVLPSIIETGSQILNSLMSGIVLILPYLIPLAMNLIKTLSDTIMENLPTIIDNGISLLTALINGISQMIPNLIPLAVEMILKIADTILGNLDKIIAAAINLIQSLINGVNNAMPKLIAAFPDMIIKICTAIINNLPGIINAGINIIGAIINGLLTALPSLIGSIPQIIGAIINAFGSADWGSIGWNLIKGIGGALESGISWLLGIAERVCGSLVDKIKSLFDIHSPSRVMRDLIGKNIIKGIGVGIETESPNLLSTAKESMQDLVSRMKSAVDFESARMAGSIGGLNGYEQTLSNIVNNNDNGVVQNITITQPVKSPSETARAIKRAGRELAFG